MLEGEVGNGTVGVAVSGWNGRLNRSSLGVELRAGKMRSFN